MFKKIVFSLFLLAFTNALAQNFDTRFLQSINSKNTRYDGIWRGVSNSVIPVAAATPLGLYGMGHFHYLSGAKQNAYMVAGSLAINTIITYSLKWSITRERPYVSNPEIYKKTRVGPYSFPSGHTSNAFTVATSLTLAYPKWYIAAPAYAWAGAVGYSRMHLGVHYPSDVLAGAITGTLSSFIAYKINQKWIKKYSKREGKP